VGSGRILHGVCSVGSFEGRSVVYEEAGGAICLLVRHTFDGARLGPDEAISLRLSGLPESLLLEIEAPFHGDPQPPNEVGSTPGLWDFEVAELFISGPGEDYTEIEVGPQGHYLALRLSGVRNPIEEGLPLHVETAITGSRWRGRVHIPREILPVGPHRINAYGIHGQGGARRYLAAFPTGGDVPDFHSLESFQWAELPE
jgi:hypothetical protein